MNTSNSTFSYNWIRASLFKRCLYSLSFVSLFTQTFLIIYTLYDTWYFTCQEPLRPYLIVHLVCCFISTPFQFYLQFGVDKNDVDPYRYDEEDDATTTASKRKNVILKRMQSTLNGFSLIWFLFGNYLILYNNSNARVMNWNSCSLTATKLYNMACIIVLYEYLIHIVPMLYRLVLTLCLRSTIMVLRYMDMIHDEIIKEKLGATPEQMSLLPLFQHTMTAPTRPALSNRRTSSQANYSTMIIMEGAKSNNHLVAVEAATATAKQQLSDLKQKESSTTPNLLYISNSQDRLCSICLTNYEEKDLLCQLWCGHHFHQQCAFDWLSLNAICPLCKRDCRVIQV